MKYLSNLNGQEFDGKFYDQGDELSVNDEHRAAAEVLVNRGDATKVEDNDPNVTSNGDSSDQFASFNADEFIGRNLDSISDDDIAALTPEQRDAVIAAENDRERPRSGLLSRLQG